LPAGIERVILKLVLRGEFVRAEDAQKTPTQSHISPNILVFEDKYDICTPVRETGQDLRALAALYHPEGWIRKRSANHPQTPAFRGDFV
jgi:hypothetical protein